MAGANHGQKQKDRVLLFSVTLDDCRVDTFSSGGPGGQHQNRTASGVRITHLASRAVGISRDERGQLTNKRRAFRRMAESKEFTDWVRLRSAQLNALLADCIVEYY